MKFSAARPDVVRAINHRWLLKFWKRERGQHRAPQWRKVDVDRMGAMSATMAFLDVVENDGAMRLVVRFHGSYIASAWGLGEYRGKYLDELMPSTRHELWLAPYCHSAKNGCPVYTIHDVKDRNGRLVHSERLLLPFSADGQNVDRILASFELVSEAGAFDVENLMTSPDFQPVLKLAVAIDPTTIL